MPEYDFQQREPDTCDSLAAMASRVSERTVSQDFSEDDTATQPLPPSFIPTATGRIRPVTGAFPPVQADAAASSREARSVQSSSSISMRRTEPVVTDSSVAAAPRRASSDPHFVD
ncbi:hypothetical protein BMOU_0314 [Bifidobacterium moukalabense DSM 27321]|uniref:Uncharacterized protein n=1 Tax=Bifidobacterium moukalabense DSM 27321 TaxID=1435051 RepID=W4NB40_9BIFI|nr:hypothetical protein BMOU_0314 [Bifidobacterium moukalabense DSM 27321]